MIYVRKFFFLPVIIWATLATAQQSDPLEIKDLLYKGLGGECI
jgi:hypothetical protein